MCRRFQSAFAVLVALVASFPVWSQQAFFDELTSGSPGSRPRYTVAIPTPENVLGHGLGERYTESGDLVRYAEAVARATERVRVVDYGRSSGGRRLVAVFVSSPENLARKAEIAERNRARAREATKDDSSGPITVYVAMGVHGDEASGGEAAAALLYHLAADERPETRRLLDDVVVVIDPAQNPDGRDRFVTLVNDRASRETQREPLAWDHQQPWPGGRVSHDLFDLNRDWFLQNQTESRARVAFYLGLMPQVVVDVHEMGGNESYFVSAPPAEPLNPHTSEQVKARWRIFGDAISRAFDAHRWSYFTQDVFPLDYPGFGGSFPLFCGAVAMTFEQASPSGAALRRDDGSTLTLRDAVLHHATACLTTIETAGARKADLFRLQAEHVEAQRAAAEHDESPFFVLAALRDPDLVDRLAATLQRCGIAVSRLDRAWTADVVPIQGGPSSKVTLAPGTRIVPVAQSFRALVMTLLDPRNELAPDFVEREARHLDRKEASEIYDVTAWNLPLLFGVGGYRTANVTGAVLVPEREPAPSAQSRRAESEPTDSRTSGALIFPGHRFSSSRLLAGLLAAGVRVRVTDFAFSTGGKSFGPGTLVVLPEPNAEGGRYETARRVARKLGLTFDVADSLRTELGSDLGSRHAKPVVEPSIVVAFGPPAEAPSAGAIRWFLETELHARHTCVGVDRPIRTALEKANVLVLPDGSADAWEKALPYEDVKAFLGRGGVVVSFRGATQYLAKKERGVLELNVRAASDRLATLHGPIVRATIDGGGWLTRGLDGELPVQLRGRAFYDLPEGEKGEVWARLTEGDGLLLSGQLPPPKAALVKQAPILIERRLNPGLVVAFTEDPLFRGASPGWFKLVANALLLGPTNR